MKFANRIFVTFLLAVSFLLFFNQTALAQTNETCLIPSSDLLSQRIAVINQYLKLLSEGKYKELIPFFTSDAIVSDVITGKNTAKNYYTGLYSYLTDPNLTFYDIYVGVKNPNILAAHFNMKIKTNKGIENRGEIVDLFVFAKDSTKINKLYIQGNKTDYAFSEN
jgi:hypothetical protein